MTKYEKQILNVLIDKYESSKSFIGTNQVNQSFTCKVEQLFPKYKDDSEYDLFCAVNESIDVLAAEGFVTAKKLKSGVVQSVTLSLDAINEAYEYIGRIPKSDIVVDLKKILLLYKDWRIQIFHRQIRHLIWSNSKKCSIAMLSCQRIALVSWNVSPKINRLNFLMMILICMSQFSKLSQK